MAGKKNLPLVAVPPNAPEGFETLLDAVLAALRDHRPQGETKKKLDHLHAAKALALITPAAYQLSHLPDKQIRAGIVLGAASPIDALVKQGEALRRAGDPLAPTEPTRRLHREVRARAVTPRPKTRGPWLGLKRARGYST